MSVMEALLSSQLSNGAWGYGAAPPGVVESTALATLALDGSTDASNRAAVKHGRTWLRALQRPDGSWPHSHEVPTSSWMTALATLALSEEDGSEGAVRSGALWLLEERGESVPWRLRIRNFFLGKKPPVELDPTLQGWPWASGTSSWVEPTCYALLALKTARVDLPERTVVSRVREGERFLVDRMCPGGGWNYGNSRVLGVDLEPYPDTTALALIGLQRAPDAGDAVTRGIEALQRLLERNDSVLSLSLSILALRLHLRPVEPLRARLAERLRRRLSEDRQPDTRSLALAAFALDPRGTIRTFQVGP